MECLELNCKNDSQPLFQHFEGLKKVQMKNVIWHQGKAIFFA
jgi:hypothetical protein